MKRRAAAVVVTLVAAVTLAVPSAGGVAQAASRPLMAAIGDSYTGGFGTTAGCLSWDYDGAYWQTTARDMGWSTFPNAVVNADPGGGFQQRGQFGTAIDELRNFPIASNTNWLIVQLGLNDSNGPNPAYEAGAVATLISVARSEAPGVKIVIVGMMDPAYNTLSTGTMLPMARAVARAATGPGVWFLDPFLLRVSMCSDQVHPSLVGHQQFGHWIASRLQSNPTYGKALHLDPVNGWWTD